MALGRPLQGREARISAACGFGACATRRRHPRVRVAVTGSTGLVGSALAGALGGAGHQVIHLVRRPVELAVSAGPSPTPSPDGRGLPASAGAAPGAARTSPSAREEVSWNPDAGTIDALALRGIDAVIHLAGARIGLRWTPEQKALMRNSRVRGTSLIARTVAELDPKPKVLICASAYGYYGDRGDEILTEDSPPGSGFLADVCQEWEAAAQPARDAGVRVVHTRFGIVLAPNGGALTQMKRVFRSGLGGRLGKGKQWWPWIAIEDAVAALCFVLERETVRGPVNVVSPRVVTNAEFARTLAKVLSRPAIFPAPSWAVSMLLGEAGREMLLASQRIVPAQLQKAGFQWLLPDLEIALRRHAAPLKS